MTEGTRWPRSLGCARRRSTPLRGRPSLPRLCSALLALVLFPNPARGATLLTVNGDFKVTYPGGETTMGPEEELELDSDTFSLDYVGDDFSGNLSIYELQAGLEIKLEIAEQGVVVDVTSGDNATCRAIEIRAREDNSNPAFLSVWRDQTENQTGLHYIEPELLALYAGDSWCSEMQPTPATQPPRIANQDWKLTIATWNLLNLSNGKLGQARDPNGHLIYQNQQLVGNYARIIAQYDVVFVQEVLDSFAFGQICWNLTTTHFCKFVSDPKGRPRSKRLERYGLVVRKELRDLVEMHDWPSAGDDDSWERPPIRARLTYPMPGSTGDPYKIDLYNLHTKPRYHPQHTTDHPYASVHDELTALEGLVAHKLRSDGIGNILVGGDLNADCTSYPARYRGLAFPKAPGSSAWTWYPDDGVATNTAARPCAYDRFILNLDAQREYIEHGIFTGNPPDTVINGLLDGKRVSDHYLLWIKIGRGTAFPTDQSSPAAGEPQPKLWFLENASCLVEDPVTVWGKGLRPNRDAGLHVLTGIVKDGERLWTATAVKRTDSSGLLAHTVLARALKAGRYSLVVDTDLDGVYRREGDVLSELDVVPCPRPLKRPVEVAVGGGGSGVHGRWKGTFLVPASGDPLAKAPKLVAEASALTPGSKVDLYVTSSLLQAGAQQGKADWQQAGGLDLEPISIPKLKRSGQQVDEAGSLYSVIWDLSRPDLTLTPGFIEEYGLEFNVVVDVDQNGQFDPATDRVDAWKTRELDAWFTAHSLLGPHSGRHGSAVKEYKALLNGKVQLDAPLDEEDDEFDAATGLASIRYLKLWELSLGAYSLARSDAQIGFRLLLAGDSYCGPLDPGLHRFEDLDLAGAEASADDPVVIDVAGQLSVDDLKAGPESNVVLRAGEGVRMEGSVRSAPGSRVCLAAPQASFSPGFEHRATDTRPPEGSMQERLLAFLVVADAGIMSPACFNNR